MALFILISVVFASILVHLAMETDLTTLLDIQHSRGNVHHSNRAGHVHGGRQQYYRDNTTIIRRYTRYAALLVKSAVLDGLKNKYCRS